MFHLSFAMPPESVDKVRPFLDECGELLPLPFKSEKFSVLNVLRTVDCADLEHSKLKGINKFAFLPDLGSARYLQDPSSQHLYVRG
jgi:hypothetical protein